MVYLKKSRNETIKNNNEITIKGKINKISHNKQIAKKFNISSRALQHYLSDNLSDFYHILSKKDMKIRKYLINKQDIKERYEKEKPLDKVCLKCKNHFKTKTFGYSRKYCNNCIPLIINEQTRVYNQKAETKNKKREYYRSKRYKEIDKIRNLKPERIEKRKVYKQKYSHSEKGRQKDKYWRKNTEKGRLNSIFNNLRRRERLNNTKRAYTKAEWFKKVDDAKKEGKCSKCGSLFTNEPRSLHQITMDHNPPLSKAPKGFPYRIDNLEPICFSCNARKQDK